MGFFSDLGKGISSVVKAHFEAVGSVAKSVGQGIGSILHGSKPKQTNVYINQRAQQATQGRGANAQFGLQLRMLQQQMLTNQLLMRHMYSPCCLF